jgi:hypothetical protein
MAKKLSIVETHLKSLKNAGAGMTVEAGWFASARYQSKDKNNSVGVPVAYIARIQEFGATIKRGKTTIVIPARPFMRGAWSDFNRIRVEKQVKIARQIVEGKINVEQALAQIGLVMEGCIVNSIKKGGWQGNAKSTIAKKGFDKPLIDTAQMWQAVTSKVVKS